MAERTRRPPIAFARMQWPSDPGRDQINSAGVSHKADLASPRCARACRARTGHWDQQDQPRPRWPELPQISKVAASNAERGQMQKDVRLRRHGRSDPRLDRLTTLWCRVRHHHCLRGSGGAGGVDDIGGVVGVERERRRGCRRGARWRRRRHRAARCGRGRAAVTSSSPDCVTSTRAPASSSMKASRSAG